VLTSDPGQGTVARITLPKSRIMNPAEP